MTLSSGWSHNRRGEGAPERHNIVVQPAPRGGAKRIGRVEAAVLLVHRVKLALLPAHDKPPACREPERDRLSPHAPLDLVVVRPIDERGTIR
jgi:hypothetical protein